MDYFYGFDSVIADMTANRCIKIDDDFSDNAMAMLAKDLAVLNSLYYNTVLRNELQKKIGPDLRGDQLLYKYLEFQIMILILLHT